MQFEHKYKSWLVLLEAVIVIELPPWVVLLYPSSLPHHFNVDVDSMSFLIAEKLTEDISSFRH